MAFSTDACKRAPALLVLAVLQLAGGCLPRVVGARDFELVISDSWRRSIGSEQVVISADGEARYIYSRAVLEHWPLEQPDAEGRTEQEVYVPHWFEIRWAVSPDELRELEELIDRRRILGLADSYYDRYELDGWWRHYKIRVNGQIKEIHCDNKTPRALRKLDAHVAPLLPDTKSGPLEGERELSRAEVDAL